MKNTNSTLARFFVIWSFVFVVILLALFYFGMQHYFASSEPNNLANGMQGIGNVMQAVIGIAVGIAGAWVVIILAQNTQRILEQEEKREVIKLSIGILNNTSNKFRKLALAFAQLLDSMPNRNDDHRLRCVALLRLSQLPKLGFSGFAHPELDYGYPEVSVHERGRRILIALIQASNKPNSNENSTDEFNNFSDWSRGTLAKIKVKNLNEVEFIRVFEYIKKRSQIEIDEFSQINSAVEVLIKTLREIEDDFECQLLLSYISNGSNNLGRLITETQRLSMKFCTHEGLQQVIYEGTLAIEAQSQNLYVKHLQNQDMLGEKFNSIMFDTYEVEKKFWRASMLAYLFRHFDKTPERYSSLSTLDIRKGIEWFAEVEGLLPDAPSHIGFIREIAAGKESMPPFIEMAIKHSDSKVAFGEGGSAVARLFSEYPYNDALGDEIYQSMDDLKIDCAEENAITMNCCQLVLGGGKDALDQFHDTIEDSVKSSACLQQLNTHVQPVKPDPPIFAI